MKRLKAPSTAEFPWSHEIQIQYLGDCTHLIEGWVDAQNSFGANIRTPYKITVKYIGREGYRLIDLKM